ncbi:hypothetical protein B0H12DRAFT_1081849, partial [Mycena haematopus]
MSTPPSQHFREFSQLPSDPVGADVFFLNPGAFVFNSMPPYRLDASDIHWHASRPFFPVLQEERAVGDYQMSEEERNSLYFLRHPAIIRVLPFLRRPRRFQRISRDYAVDLLDRAVPVFRTFSRAYPHLPHTPLQEGLVRALVLFVQRVHLASRTPCQKDGATSTWAIPLSIGLSANACRPSSVSRGQRNSALRTLSLEILASPPRLLSSAEQDRTAQVLNRGIPCLLQLARELRERRVSPDFAHGVFNSTRSLIQGFPEGRRNRAWTLALPAYNEDFSKRVPAGTSSFPMDHTIIKIVHLSFVEFGCGGDTRSPSGLLGPIPTGAPFTSEPTTTIFRGSDFAARTHRGIFPFVYSINSISSPPFMLSAGFSQHNGDLRALARRHSYGGPEIGTRSVRALLSRTPGPSADAGGESTLLSQTLEESHEDALCFLRRTHRLQLGQPLHPLVLRPWLEKIASFRDAN